MSAEVREWTLEGALDELVHMQQTMGERGLAFVLGAGASVSSGIPAAAELASQWLHELHRRECREGIALGPWLKGQRGALQGVDPEQPAAHYASILAARYQGDCEAGYVQLDRLLDRAAPSSGYRWLAAILQYSRHRLAISANFDNLIADALSLNGGPAPLAIGHESLAGYARPGSSRPLLARLHHDPLSGSSLPTAGWLPAMRRLFRHYTPIIVGYGGNDACLSTLLASLQPGDICGRPLWCYQDQLPPAALREWLARHNGILLQIDDFDSFMARLGSRLLNDSSIMPAELQEALPAPLPALPPAEAATAEAPDPARTIASKSAAGQPDPATAQQPDSEAARWLARIARTDEAYERLDLYQQALQECPSDGPLLASYAAFLASQDADPRMLGKIYQHASEQAPDSPQVCAGHALFLASQGNLAEATRLLNRALQLAPSDAQLHACAARFVSQHLGDTTQAASLYQRALSLQTDDPQLLAEHAAFLQQLGDVEGADAQYRRALSLAPDALELIVAYADFLQQQGRELETADALYRHACHLQPQDASLLAAHARLCGEARGDFEAALALYAQALQLEPDNAELYACMAATLLCRRDPNSLADARELLQRGMELGLQAGQPAQALAEVLLLAILSDELTEGESNLTLLACLKGVLLMDFPRRQLHDFNLLLQRVLPQVVRDRHELYVTLAAAILDPQALQPLRQSPFWRNIEAIDPFAASRS